MVKSIDKGKRGEREAVRYLQSLGFPDAERTQQYNGLGASDVRCPETLPSLHVEVKRAGGVDLGTSALERALTQAERDAAGRPWCVLWRPDRKSWRLSYRRSDGVALTVAGALDIASVLRELSLTKGGRTS